MTRPTAFVVHTHYIRGQFAPSEVIVVPITGEIRMVDTPSPTPPDREPEPEAHFPAAFWDRTVWWTHRDDPAEFAEYLASWHHMTTEHVLVTEPVPATT